MEPLSTTPRSPLAEMPEANYLIGHEDGPYYRLIMRYFYERHRAHAHYVRSDEIVAYVRRVFPDYDDEACRRHLAQMEAWRLVRALPEQMRPATVADLRRRPRVYQAERVALRLEELRVRLEEELAAATINPAALENLLRRLEELVAWAAGHLGPGAGDPPDAPDSPAPPEAARAFDLWNAVYSAFDAFARGVEDYVSDLPRHRPKETLGYEEFLAYRDAITRYLSGYIRHLFDRREQIRVLLERLRPYAEALVAQVAAVAAAQVRADGSRPDREQEAARCRAEWEALCGYFREGGDVDILLDQAQGWIADITRHARRLSEQHLGSTVRAELLLDLARRFARAESLAACERLAQVAFGATLPLHWKGSAPPPPPAGAWESPPVEVPLTPVRRGGRRRVQGDATEDRSPEQIARMQAEAQAREAAARELAALFGPDGRLDLGALRLASPRQRQQILHLLYRALAQGGVASVGYRNWTVAVSLPPEPELGRVEAPDGVLILPRFRLELRRGRDRRG